MDVLLELLNTKFQEWSPIIADQVRQYITEIMELADKDALDVLRSRAIEQEVLDMLDESTAR